MPSCEQAPHKTVNVPAFSKSSRVGQTKDAFQTAFDKLLSDEVDKLLGAAPAITCTDPCDAGQCQINLEPSPDTIKVTIKESRKYDAAARRYVTTYRGSSPATSIVASCKCVLEI